MLADQFRQTATAARTTAAIDDLARKLWRAHAEHKISDANAKAISEALQARRNVLSGEGAETHQPAQPDVTGLPRPSRRSPRRARKRREKVFGPGRPRALDRNTKVRIMHLARCLKRRTEAGKHYGVLTGKCVDILEVLLWIFHNARSGLCFPSYERIAEAAGCARSTVAEAIMALEDVRILSWVNRLKRVAEATRDLFGHRMRKTRVIRASNGYAFIDPKAPADRGFSSKSDFQSGTSIQESVLPLAPPAPRVLNPDNPLEAALIALGKALGVAM